MGFPCTCLPISKNSSIVTFKDTFNDGQGSQFKNILLLALWLECHIKAKNSFLFSNTFEIGDNNLSSIGNNINNIFITLNDLFIWHWSASDCDFDTLVLIAHF